MLNASNKIKKVLLIGTGNVGKHILEFAARSKKNIEWVIGDIDIDNARWACNNAQIGAAHHRLHPIFRPIKLDLFNSEKTIELLNKEKPDAIINCTVLHTWHLIRCLPEQIYAKISAAGLGAWLPCQLALSLSLSKSIKDAGLTTFYINTSLSCLTNPVMGKLNLAPTIGIGNIDLIAPAVLTYIAQQKNIDRSRIKTFQVCHHQHWVYPREAGYKPNAPYYLKILIDDMDVTSEFDTDTVMFESVKLYSPGVNFTTVSASSALKNLNAMLYNENLHTHSPGPNGLPGGYPVLLNKQGAEVVLPEDISLNDAIKMNEESGKLDSIEKIEDDGTVIFTDYAYQIMKETLGFNHQSFHAWDAKDLAFEQIACFNKLAKKYSI